MTDEQINAVVAEIKKITGNSMNVNINFEILIAQIPNLTEVEIADVLLYLEAKGLIDGRKQAYLGKTIIRSFSITVDFINNYP